MSENKIVYVVTNGSYSDYRILGIYSTRENAEKAKELFVADNDIEPWQLDNFGDYPEGKFFYCVRMDRYGNSSVERESCLDMPNKWAPYGDDANVAFYVWAKDEISAVKIANERRTGLLASNQWTTDWKFWNSQVKLGKIITEDPKTDN